MSRGRLFVLSVLFLLGTALITIPLLLSPYFKERITTEVEQNVLLTDTTEAFKAWQAPPAPIFMDYYFFDVVNPEEVVKGGKPVVRQLGPYVYREVRKKIDVNFTEDRSNLLYREAKWFTFAPELSKGTENDTITTLNIAILAIADRVRYESDLTQGVVKAALQLFNEKLFVQKTVHEMLWGYSPDIFTKLKHLLPHWLWWIIPNAQVGFNVGPYANGSSQGVLNISTGLSDIKNIGKIHSWNGLTELSYWNTASCNMINGTDGSMWHPFLTPDEKLYIFITDMCRSVYIEYEKEAYITSSQIPVYQYQVPSALLADAASNPDNAGFCTPSGNCMKSGVMNVSACKDGAPIIISLPHFLDAHEDYQNAVEGLNPHDQTKRTIIYVEPITGLVMSAHKMMQVNFYLAAQTKAFDQTMMISQDIVFPLFWVDEHASIGDFEASMFKSMLLQPIETVKILQYCVMGLGALILLVVLLVTICSLRHRRRPSEKEQPLSDSDSGSDGSLPDGPLLA